MFEVKLDNQPEKLLKKFERYIFNRFIKRLDGLKINPVPHDAKRIVGYEAPTFRIRVGKYRILYRINYELKLIIVVKIDHRERVYK